jgi:hypothetical protein
MTSWRLPNEGELYSLVLVTAQTPSSGPDIDVTAFPQTPATPSWSSTGGAYVNEVGTLAWYVDFYMGLVGVGIQSGTLNVRCVHGP